MKGSRTFGLTRPFPFPCPQRKVKDLQFSLDYLAGKVFKISLNYLGFGQSQEDVDEPEEVAAGYDVHVAMDSQRRGQDDGHHEVSHGV